MIKKTLKRFSTITHTFSSTIDLSDAQIYVTYSQDDRIIVEKSLNDVDMSEDGKTFNVILTQEDTSKFRVGKLYVQFRYLFRDGRTNPSNRWVIDVEDIDKKEILEWQ